MLAAVCSAVFPVLAQRPAAMSVLPDGAVQAQAWLRHQLELQRDGLTGHAEELYDDIGRSDWLTGAGRGGQYAWERGPYYAKGLVALALALDDPALKAKAKRWVDAILASQRPNGDFGPRARNWWANMIALWLVRDWCAATDDPRVPEVEHARAQVREVGIRKRGVGERGEDIARARPAQRAPDRPRGRSVRRRAPSPRPR